MFDFNINQVVGLLGLELKKGESNNMPSYNVKCPNCGDWKLNIVPTKGVWRCAHCNESGGTLQLYVRFVYNEPYTRELGHKAKKEIEKLLNMDFNNLQKSFKSSPKEYKSDVTTLSDTELNRVYSKLLKIPQLRLSHNDFLSLKKRGLSDEVIKENGYRTMPERLYFPKGKVATIQEFKENELDELYKSKPELKRLGRSNIISGVYIGAYMRNVFKVKLDNVPGFFRFKSWWCFVYRPGILIPVRNIKGQIVGFQTYTGRKSLKYVTLSSKGYDLGCSGGTRVHFPIHNPAIGENASLNLTEGPLKADVALSLSKKPNTAFMAILGVNATNDLKNQVIGQLKENGVKEVFNSLDMDKLTNIHVMQGSKKIRTLFQKEDIAVKQAFWDKKTALSVLQSQEKLLEEHKLPIIKSTRPENVFIQVGKNTKILHDHHVEFPDKWPNEATKGVDDYLLNQNKANS